MTRPVSNGTTTDWQLDALLAAGVLACAAPALGAASAADTPCPPEDPAAWVRARTDHAEALAEQARKDLIEVWGAARTALWGDTVAAIGPRLLVYRTSVERSARDGGETPVWSEVAPGTEMTSGARVVVLVHGIDESGFVWDDLAPALFAAGLTPVRFDYANDQSIARTADQLAASLRSLRRGGIESVAIVGHSSGGLAARDVVTRPARPDANDEGELPVVSRLILLATPNRGSTLAPAQALSEAREHLARRMDGAPLEGDGWIHSTRDGSGEAAGDLTAGSAYLAELNSRSLPRGLRVTNITARMVCASERERLRAAISRGLVDVLDPDAARTVTGLVDDALDGLGDGVVSVESMALDGVEDTVEVRGNHRSMIRRMRIGAEDRALGPVPPAVPVIVNRLAADDHRP